MIKWRKVILIKFRFYQEEKIRQNAASSNRLNFNLQSLNDQGVN
jgi:hypothetical protein